VPTGTLAGSHAPIFAHQYHEFYVTGEGSGLGES
jgi:hypothetical protein